MNTISFRSPVGADDAPALIAVHDACREADGVLERSVFEYRPTVAQYENDLANSDPADWILAMVGDEVVGYGHTRWDWSEADGNHCYLHNGWVKPSWRGQGIGRDLLARLEARCHAKAERDGTTAKAEYGANATGTEHDAQRLITRCGYHTLYTVVEMEFALGHSLPEPVLLDGYDLRPALPEHYRAIWQCIGDAYYVHGSDNRGREIADEGSYRGYFHGDTADPTLWFVAWEKSRIAGQCLARVRSDGVGEVYEVSVGHPHRRKGLAKALVTMALQELQKRDVNAIRLFTGLENPTKAWELYESVGFKMLKTFPRWRKTL